MSAVTVNEHALATLANIGAAVDNLAAHLGTGSKRYREMADSWLRAQANVWQLLATGGTVSRDEDRSLYLVTSYGMHVGVIFFRDRAYAECAVPADDAAPVGGLPAVSMCRTHDGAPFLWEATACAVKASDVTVPGMCLHGYMALPGTWSLHS